MLRVLPRRPTKTNLATLLVERGWQYAEYRYSTLFAAMLQNKLHVSFFAVRLTLA